MGAAKGQRGAALPWERAANVLAGRSPDCRASGQSAERTNVKRTTNRTIKRTTLSRIIAVGIALALAIVPATAFAETGDSPIAVAEFASVDAGALEPAEDAGDISWVEQTVTRTSHAMEAAKAKVEEVRVAEAEKTDKLLAYDSADIAAIGTQEQTGHTICCPSFSCAYADAVMDGTVHDHGYYSCSCCMWTDWGGGNSSDRYVGTDEELLREAYDQIANGRPTVIHVAASYGEHWIALIGYAGAADPDHLTLANFIALDPWDGAQIVASDRFSLYGDGCEHVSER